MMGILQNALVVILFLPLAHAFYLDLAGKTPGEFYRGDPIQVRVDKLSSTKTQLRSDYYSLPYCRPDHIFDMKLNLREFLRGDHVQNSMYTFRMRESDSCKVVCRLRPNAESVKLLKDKIDDDYRVNMFLDHLPVSVRWRGVGPAMRGFRVGVKGEIAGSNDMRYWINNHLSFKVLYHTNPETDSARIVGFEVTPLSIHHEVVGGWGTKYETCSRDMYLTTSGPQEIDDDEDIVFTYDVSFQASEMDRASNRETDLVLLTTNAQIYWLSIISCVAILLLMVVALVVTIKTRSRVDVIDL